MVVEHFREGRSDAVYTRFRERGRMLPDGLRYVDSWLAADGARCFQMMETEDASTFERWCAAWDDLVAFEIVELGPKPAGD